MIYLDNSATTQPCGVAVEAMRKSLEAEWFNPSAPYREAMRVEKRMQTAREAVAAPLGIGPERLVFTGSGTEADSLAILGAAARFRGPRRVLLFAAEHPAVRETAAQLEAMGHAVGWLPATDDGLLDSAKMEALLDRDVGLVSVMQVGNETGAVQPVAAVGRLVKRASPDALLHVDGVQGFLRLPLRLEESGVDLYTVSAHKVHGPKGVGALALGMGVRLLPRVAGGGQESGLRSGTENTAGIAGFGGAVVWVRAQGDDIASRLRSMKLALYTRLAEGIDGLRVNGPAPDSADAAPHILNVSLPGAKGEVMLHALEEAGVLIGTGAACSSRRRQPSAAFAAMRAPKWAEESALRFSLGLMNTMDEVTQAAEAVLRCYAKYRVFPRR